MHLIKYHNILQSYRNKKGMVFKKYISKLIKSKFISLVFHEYCISNQSEKQHIFTNDIGIGKLSEKNV